MYSNVAAFALVMTVTKSSGLYINFPVKGSVIFGFGITVGFGVKAVDFKIHVVVTAFGLGFTSGG